MEAIALAEWHQDPEHIFETWTEEKFVLLCERRNRRIDRLNRQQAGEEEEDEGITSMEALREAARRRQLESARK